MNGPMKDSFAWPHAARAAVSLTYDDGLPSQLDVAVPQLDARGLAGTFFLNPGLPRFAPRREDWRKLARSRHELANHTFTHPCSREMDWVPKGRGLQDLGEGPMLEEIERGKRAILELGIAAVPSFAYPCGQSFHGEDLRSYAPLVGRQHAYARAIEGRVAEPATVDLLMVPSVDGALGAKASLARVEEAMESGGWLVLMFHGVGGDHLEIPAAEHAAILDGLGAKGGQVWVAGFGEVGARVALRREAQDGA